MTESEPARLRTVASNDAGDAGFRAVWRSTATSDGWRGRRTLRLRAAGTRGAARTVVERHVE